MMNEMTYRQAGDYRIPALRLENEGQRTLGKYGRMRRAYLEQNNPMLLNDMILTETLFPHLWEIEDTANARVELLMKQYLEQNPAPDKETDQLGWVRHMNSLKAQAEACVLLTQKRNEKDYEFEIEVSLMIDSDRLFEDSRPTYTNIRKYVFDKYGIKLQLKDIADVKRDYGMKMKVNKHLIKGDEPVRRKCTPNKRKYIIEALKYYHVI